MTQGTNSHAPTPGRFRGVAVLTPHSVERMHLNDAADEIERLSIALREIVDRYGAQHTSKFARDRAMEALKDV